MWQTKCIAAICLGKINMETINRKILVTGSAGFIGSALVLRLLTVELMDYIAALEKALGKSATTVADGIKRFVASYRNEFKLI